ncbi:MAG: cyclic nucleotide-binding domain-containing protein [Candidatus Latescibacteria bacterium]|nr:cyclic nucleotide-binding domain-containing protein [Candidatus Latescibacterota bacterium]
MAADPFWGNLFRRSAPHQQDLQALLRQVPVFADLTQRELRKMASILHRRRYAAEESIVREGEQGVGMYVILSGRVEVLQVGHDGAMQLLATFGPGDFFGEQALLDETPRTASVVALEACQALGFFRTDLLDLIEGQPRLGLKIVMRISQMISVRLRHTNRLLKEAQYTEKGDEVPLDPDKREV